MVGDNNYLDKIFFNELFILFLIIPIIYFLIYFIEKHYFKICDLMVTSENKINKKKFCIVTFIFLMCIYLLYYFTFYPGGIYVDAFTSLDMLLGKNTFTNQQPVLYTLSMNIVKPFVPDYNTGFAIYTAIQAISMVSILTYFVYWLLDKNLNSKVATLIVLMLGLYKLFPLYSVSVWKDTPFSLVLLLYILAIIDIILDFKHKEIKIKDIVKIVIYTILIQFLRNNGIYISFAMFALLAITTIILKVKKEQIKNLFKLLISILVSIILYLVIVSLYPIIGISTSSTLEESIGIPIQQVARVVCTDGNITEEQKELIDKVIPTDIIKKKYKALLVDPIKWDNSFNSEYLNENLPQYTKLYLELFLQNPGEYFNAYMLQTSGFWTLNVKGKEAFHSAVKWDTLVDVEQQDLILENFFFSLEEDLLAVAKHSGGYYFWITILSAYLTFKTSHKKFLMGYLPGLLLWATVMISTPMGSALRYVYILVLMLPLNLVYPAIAKNYEESCEQKKLNEGSDK